MIDPDVLGYVVVTWNQASHWPEVEGPMHDDLEWAREVAAMERKKTAESGRGERHTVHAVMREPIEEDGDNHG